MFNESRKPADMIIGTNFVRTKGGNDESQIYETNGDFSAILDGETYMGISYLDVKGTIKKDSSGQITSISLSGKVGGGSNGAAVFSGTLKATFTTE